MTPPARPSPSTVASPSVSGPVTVTAADIDGRKVARVTPRADARRRPGRSDGASDRPVASATRWTSRGRPTSRSFGPRREVGSRRTCPRTRCRAVTPGTGFARHLEWERTLFDARWAVVSWPEAYGGREASLWEWLIFEEEYYRAGAPQRVTQNGIFLLAPTIFEFGTLEQQDRYLPTMASGEETWCQGWSEPDAGSDLAAIASKARPRRDGGRLAAQRPEDLDDAGRVLHPPLRPVPHRPRGATAPRAHLLPRAARHAGRHRARLRPARRRRGLRRGVLRRRVRPRRPRAR